MIAAAERELQAIGITEKPRVALADAGYWHQAQMQNIAARGIQVLVPPDASKRADTRPGWNDGMYAFMRRVLVKRARRTALSKTPSARRARVRRLEVQPQGSTDSSAEDARPSSSEWRLINATHNLLKLHRHQIALAGA